MPARVLDGRAVSQEIQKELMQRVERLRSRGITPALGIALVGADPASAQYVRAKERAAKTLGVRVVVERRKAGETAESVEHLLDMWNADQTMHGIVVQRPLPPPLSADAVIFHVLPQKDVDGLHPENVGLLVMDKPRFIPPTPAGILELLQYYGIASKGKRIVIVGRSMLVGKPLALLLLRKAVGGNATVTMCHRETPRLSEITRTADILIVAAGSPKLIASASVRPGAVVVDVGLTRTAEGWQGDVDAEPVASVASAISPVPGGVGPLTVMMLFRNVIQAAEQSTD